MLSGLAILLAPATAAFAVQSSAQPAPWATPSPRGGEFERKRAIAHKAADPRSLIKDAYDSPRWFRDGHRFLRWAASGANEGTWTIVDAQSKVDRPVLSRQELAAQLATLLGKPVPTPKAVNYALTPDEQSVVFTMAGRAFSLDLAGGRVSEAGPGNLAVLQLTGGKLSPDGRLAAVGEKGGFSLKSSRSTIVERKGQEFYEWNLPDKPWSPDGRFMMVSRLDKRKVHKIPIIDYSGPLEKVGSHPYPKTGTPLPPAEYYLVNAATGRMLQASGTKAEGYYFHSGWWPDSSEALILFLSRDGKRLDLRAVNPATGASRLVLREENTKTFVGDLNFIWIGEKRQVTPLPDNKGFLWLSERDGWRNIYLYDRAGKLQRQLTSGNFVVHQVLKATTAEAYFVASIDGDAPNDRHIFRVGLGDGQVTRLSKDPGFHQATFSPTGAYFADSHSAPTRPRVSEIFSADGSFAFRYAQADVSELLKLGYKPPEHFRALAADGVTPIYGAIIKPYDFDPSKRYPVINMVYNGPFTANVPSGYAGSGSVPMMSDSAGNGLSQMGFITVIVDPRGSPGRSKAFHDASYGKLGQIEIPDIVTAIRQAAATRPYMDLNRAGIVGHSYGGYYALRGMVTAPDFFKAGYAGASGSLMQESENHEANMGLITVNPLGYEQGSNELLAGNLKGALKMMHGTSDPLASLASTMQMSEALIKAGKHFDLLIMPGQGHNPPGKFNTYYFDDRLMFFVDKLGGPQ